MNESGRVVLSTRATFVKRAKSIFEKSKIGHKAA
jgi:hypothetical protein